MSVIEEIAAERTRQVKAEGWSLDHDDSHDKGEMAKAAAAYAYFGGTIDAIREVDMLRPIQEPKPHDSSILVIQRMWPWSWQWWKPKDRRRDLIRAAALIVAEIERLDRQQTKV